MGRTTFGRIGRRLASVIVLCLLGEGASHIASAQGLTAQDREELIRMRTSQGGQVSDVEVLLQQVNEAAAAGLPTEPLVNKLKEGLAKGVDPKRIDPVLRQMSGHLEQADRLIKELKLTPGSGARQGDVTLLAESLNRGVTADEVRVLHRTGRGAQSPLTSDTLASGAKSLSLIKEAKIPAPQGSAVVGEAVRQGYRSRELLDLGRELKRRGGDFQAGRADLQAIRERISRGERPERLFREDSGGGHGGGGESRIERQERSSSGHGDRGERSERPERSSRPERSGSGRDH